MKPALFVEVTRKCNHACTYCGEWRFKGKHSSFSLAEYKRLFEAARDAGLPRINFTGGEPTLVKDLAALVETAIEVAHPAGMQVHLTTNGTTIEILKKLWELPIDLVKVNLQSLDRRAFTEITGHDLLDKVTRGIDYLLKQRVPLVVHYVVTQSSIDSMDKLLAFAAERRLDLKLFEIDTNLSTKDKTPVHTKTLIQCLDALTGQRATEPSPGLPIRRWMFEDGRSIQLIASGEQKYNSEICDDCSSYPCDYGLYSLSFSPAGFLYPCLTRHDWGAMISFEDERQLARDLDRYSKIIEDGVIHENVCSQRRILE